VGWLPNIFLREEKKMRNNSRVKKVSGTGQHIWTDIPEEHLRNSGISDGDEVIVTSKNGKIVIQKKSESFLSKIFGR